MEGCNPANLRWYYLIEDVVDDEHDEQMKFKLKQCQKSLCKYPLVINNVDHCGLLRHVDENVMKKIKRRFDLERRRTNDIMSNYSLPNDDDDENILIGNNFDTNHQEGDGSVIPTKATSPLTNQTRSSNSDNVSSNTVRDQVRNIWSNKFAPTKKDNDEASQSDSDQSDYVPNKSPILSREEQEQKDFELAMQLSQEEDSNVDGGQNLSVLLNAKPSAAFADDISMNNSIEEESPPKQSSNQKIQQLPSSSSSATNNFKSGSNFENDDYVDFSDDENFTQNSLSSLPKSHPTPSLHPNGKHEVISIDSDSDEENKKLFKRLAKFSSSSDNDETKPMTRIKDRGNVEVIAGTSKSKIDQKVDKPVKNNNAKKTLQEILAADSVLSGRPRNGTTKKRKPKNETISSSDENEDNTNGTIAKNKKKTLQEILAADSVLSGRPRNGTKKRKQKNETISSSDENEDTNITNRTNSKNKKKKLATNRSSGSPKKYMPKPGSGGYAILIALYENEKSSDNNSEAYLTKAQLQEASQNYCIESMTHTKPGTNQYYTAWSSCTTLTKKELIKTWSNPKKIKLTDAGREVAKEIMKKREQAANLMNCDGESASQNTPSQGLTDSFANASWLGEFDQSYDQNNSDFVKNKFSKKNQILPPKSKSSATPSSSSSYVPQSWRLRSGDYRIILIVDNMEVKGGSAGGKKSRKAITTEELDALGIEYDVRKLTIGDFVWIAKGDNDEELVLPYIVERKRMDDLRASIMDNRYREQKQRIHRSGLPNKIYLVEEISNRYDDVTAKKDFGKGLDRKALDQAVSNVLIRDDFHVKLTKSQKESMRYLSVMTNTLRKKYEGVTLHHCSYESIGRAPKDKYLMEFKEFYEVSRADKPLTLREMFCNMLICQRGLSTGMAWAITEKYSTLASLKRAYDRCNTEKDKENLIAGIVYGGNYKKKIGAAVSKTLYWLFNEKDYEHE